MTSGVVATLPLNQVMVLRTTIQSWFLDLQVHLMSMEFYIDPFVFS